MLAARKSRGRRWKASQYRLRVSCLVEQPALGRLALRQPEQMVLVEPREGMMLIKVRAAEFGSSDAKVDASRVAIAAMIIKRRSGSTIPRHSRIDIRKSTRIERGQNERVLGEGALGRGAHPRARSHGCPSQ